MIKTKKPFTIDMLPNDVFKKWFKQSARSWQIWRIKAEYLYHAANYLLKVHQKAKDKQVKLLLKEIEKDVGHLKSGNRSATKTEVKLIYDSSVVSVHRMLIGYSIENLVKAILIQRNQNLIKDNGTINKQITVHLSVELMKECNISLSSEEIDLITMLSWYVRWAGRYPVPLKVEDIKPYRRFDGLWFQPGDLQLKNEEELINNLYSKLAKFL